jgi:hypothetical protein
MLSPRPATVMKLLPDCRDVATLMSRSQDCAPPLALQDRMRLHLRTCQGCRTVDGQMRFVRGAIQAMRDECQAPELPSQR